MLCQKTTQKVERQRQIEFTSRRHPHRHPLSPLNPFRCHHLRLDERLKSNDSTTINDILRHITSPKLLAFDLDFCSMLPEHPRFSESEPWFHEVCRRNVENLTLNATDDYTFRIPACLFNSQSLVNLELYGMLKSKLPKNGDLSVCSSFHLPNLKTLALSELDNVPTWLPTLIQSCPLLEDLNLCFSLDDDPPPHFFVHIIAPNLKSLCIRMRVWIKMRHTRISIDAPKLTNLAVYDSSSIYSFVQIPTTLVKAGVYLKRLFGEWVNGGSKYYLEEMSKFIGGLSSVSNLMLMLDSHSNIFADLNSVNLPVFSNVVYLETNCFKDLLFSFECFPNLEHLVVNIYSEAVELPMEQRYWLLPNTIPDCILSELKIIQIKGLQAIGDDLRLLAYILSNANVLEKLCVDVRMVVRDGTKAKNENDEAYAVWKEGQFCRSLFKLPRRSSSCEVVVSVKSINASGNALHNGYLTCQMYVGK